VPSPRKCSRAHHPTHAPPLLVSLCQLAAAATDALQPQAHLAPAPAASQSHHHAVTYDYRPPAHGAVPGPAAPAAGGGGRSRPATLLAWRFYLARASARLDLFEASRGAHALARAAVAAYFLHLVALDVSAWRRGPGAPATGAAAAGGAALGPGTARAAFPAASLALVLPAALAVIAGVHVPAAAALLATEMMWKASQTLWAQALLMWRFGRAPSELLAKKLAMVGAAALLAAHPGSSEGGWKWEGGGGGAPPASRAAPKATRSASSFAGVPLLDAAVARVRAEAGAARSALLLAGRLLVCGLLFVGGLSQLRRVAARGWRPWRPVHSATVSFADGHDNNFLLAQLALALPFALGWRVGAVSRALAATLTAEAVFCWPPWRAWPNAFYAAHVRSHFFVNLGVAGGLVLARSFGGQVFTVDRLLRKKSR
jgi:hypothetical protein